MRRLIPACLLIGAFSIPASAEADVEVLKLRGSFQPLGVSGTGAVRVEVVAKDGVPVRLLGIAYKNLPARCNASEVPLDPIYEANGKLTGSASHNSNGSGIETGRRLRWVSNPSHGAWQVLMTGRLSRSGRRISNGRLEIHNRQSDACQSAVGTFTAEK